LLGSLSLAVWAALGNLTALSVSAIEMTGLIFLYYKSALQLRVDQGWLYVGKAKIEVKYISGIDELSGQSLRAIRGPSADPASYLAIRFWVNRAIKIEINDPRDRTPYWLISTRFPAELAAALKI